MPSVFPAFASVRPRVTRRGMGEARPVEDVLVELAEGLQIALVEVVGPHGSGKSTAIAHVAAALGHDERFVFLDEPTWELDFYLVDLRGAKLDPDQREHVLRCGAILDEALA